MQEAVESPPANAGPDMASATTEPTSAQNARATAYMTALIGRELRVHTTDSRVFVGTIKCTDRERNVVLGNCFEFRTPSVRSVSAYADMLKRYVGLVVVPGEHIVKVELTP